MDKVTLLLIATNKYKQFITPLLDSVEKYFFINDKVNIVLFTDSDSVDSRATHVKVEHQPWPLPTLLRYKTFLEHHYLWKSLGDYTAYCDADMLFVGEVDKEILPDKDELVVVKHPGFWDKVGVGSWETRKESMCYVEPRLRVNYVAGGFQFGPTKTFFKLADDCNDWIQKDLNRGIVPVYHDESALNCWITKNNKKLISPAYVYPEGGDKVHSWFTWKEEARLVALNKNHEELRN